jgi:hypothetical protein
MITIWQRHIVEANPVDPRILRASSLSFLKPLSPLYGRSRFNLSSKACAFFGVIGIFAGTYSSSSSALAEAEESAGQEINNPGYSVPTLSNGTLTNLLINSYADEEVARYLSTLDSSHNAADSVDRDGETYTGSHPAFHSATNAHGFDDPPIPEAVWSLDASTGAHLDHISAGPGSDIYAVFGSRAEINDFWMRAIASSWIYTNTDQASGFFFTPIQFQVASCGGNSAEHSDLEYCNSADLLGDQTDDSPVKSEKDNSSTATQSASNNVISSSGPPGSNSTAQPITAPLIPFIADQALLADQSPLQETLSVLGPCDVSASCAGVEIDPLEAPVDAPALDPVLLTGDPAPSSAPPSWEPQLPGPTDGGGSGAGLAPVFSSPPEPVTTPEASTWVMTVVGFGFMAFTFSKRRRPRNNPISVIDVSEET